MEEKILNAINMLKSMIEEAKKTNSFNLSKIIEDESSSFKVGNKEINRIKEFSNLEFDLLPKEIREDYDLSCIIWHFINLEDIIEEKVKRKYLSSRLGLIEVNLNDDVDIDRVNQKDLFVESRDLLINNKYMTIEQILKSYKLTKRQKEVLMLIQQGFKQVEMAEKLGVDESAVSKIIKRIIERIKNQTP